uniref:site-specific DNA-methyltransferase (adenine-specific) n=1 Tax=Candidatus Kentrum sp. DK TaxID=2126562 RepID=A0A450TL38_9GAMM|nr:MAG: adenine-specific DNA-methyltransferase [Candidatus Kentron sp. DK]
MEKMKMRSPNLTQENIAGLRELFPGCVTEARDDNSELRLSVDFDQLRQELSDAIVEGPQERYRLDWPGKRAALLAANAPIARTLRPCREESVGFDTTRNLFIEGDNLDALKLLQETYLGKVKMIYIDPPYNTGNDFIYRDRFAEDSEGFLRRSNQKDEEGNRLVANTEANGRFHSDWLSMMYPRLKLARNLLRDDGVVFVSIDDNEVANFRKIYEEIFGELNFIGNVVWEKKYTRTNDARFFSDNHDHILVYCKNKDSFSMNRLKRTKKQDDAYTNLDNDRNGSWKLTPLQAKSGSDTDFKHVFANGIEWSPPLGRFSAYSHEKLDELYDNGELYFGKDGKGVPQRKTYLKNVKGLVPVTIWPHKEVGQNHEANNEMKSVFGNQVFDNPKPTRLIKRMLEIGAGEKDDSIILDFFSGSATTAHAVMQLNAEDGGNRRFIMVQLPEPCDEKSEAFKAGYNTIAEIGKERIRRAGTKIKEENAATAPNLDTGFRVLKIDSSNMADVYYTPDAIDQNQLEFFTDNIKPGRAPEDLLFQVLLDWGVDLSLPIRRETRQGKSVFFVAEEDNENALVACFDTGVDEALVKELAKLDPRPRRVVFRDTGFASDAVKINVEQIFRQLSPHTEVKAI